ncbi:DUF393 domain-containing protein (plasmid) [Photobacterium sp. DA100]|uniref:thiol-disulfide oxidoreductase DCC family protein n=1 Tax=Photobacterium sp. DA100 TaxID=3027472 RepID=UPI0024793288|nr:DUF393 domain-containing protein [Photobacterium sp. DA100]WEM45489.1 DUF393 domain-containing protein [Photobacterium sp. DA100]
MPKRKLTIFYDGACPSCVDDRDWFEHRVRQSENIDWFDITGREDELRALGIDPYLAVRELHVMNAKGEILKEMDAYILLCRQLWYLRPLAWFMGLPFVKIRLSRWYRKTVDRRLAAQGRTESEE